LQLLEPIKARYKDLSWADLIVLAGTAAQEAAAGPGAPAFPFCGGRTDAADGANTDHLAPRKYVNATVAVIDNIKVSGLTPAEAVALAGQLRSPAAQKAQGYSSSRADSAGKLSNEFFKVRTSQPR
jgi:catalase (peroxidase I)